MTTEAPIQGLTITDRLWEDVELPSDDLPSDDGDKMESPWHFGNAALLLASYTAAQGGRAEDYFMGANMLLYYCEDQARTTAFKGPDVFLVKNVDGTRNRDSWIAWKEDGRYPDVIFELLSDSTQAYDLGDKKTLYEQTFRATEYFCIGKDVEQLLGWRLEWRTYVPIAPDERGWLWSEELQLWLGPWHGRFLTFERTWARFYHPDGTMVLLPEEAERLRADQAEQRADYAEQRADYAEQRADQAEQRADYAEQRAAQAQAACEQERRRAEQERQRADDLAACLFAMEEELGRLRG